MVEHAFHWLTWQYVEPNVDDEVVLWKDDGSTYVHEVVTVKERQGKEDGGGTLVVETGGWRSDSRTVPTTAVAAILNQPTSAAEHLRVEKVYGEYRGWQAIEDASRPIMTYIDLKDLDLGTDTEGEVSSGSSEEEDEMPQSKLGLKDARIGAGDMSLRSISMSKCLLLQQQQQQQQKKGMQRPVQSGR